MTRPVIARDKLGALTKIAQGGQGVVYQAPNVKVAFSDSMVYKEYKPQTRANIDVSALAAMPALVENSLSYAQAEQLVSLAAWPCALVEEAGATTGFVMPAFPAQFFTTLTTAKSASTSAAEFQHLLNHPSVLAARGITIGDAQRYALLRETAAALAFLHTHGVCVGDISPKNLLFSLNPHPAVYFIDCDAMRINSTSVLPQVETPGWQAPPGEELATIYTDTYKLGLLALRLLAGDHDTANPTHLPVTTPDLLRQAITDTLTKPAQQRPLPHAWNYALGHAIEQAQHQQKTATPPPISAAALSIPVVHSRPPTTTPPLQRAWSGFPTPAPQFTPPPWPPAAPAWEQPPIHGGLPAGYQPLPPPIPAPKRSPAIPLLIGAVVVLVIALALAIGVPALTKRQSAAAPVAQPSATSTTANATTTTSTTTTAPPIAESALDGLLLSPDQIATIENAAAPLSVIDPMNEFVDGTVSDTACEGVATFRDTHTFASTGWTAMRGNQVQDPNGHAAAAQMVVLFSSWREARAFFNTSAQSWLSCANRKVTATMPGGSPATIGISTVSHTGDTLTAMQDSGVQHVMTVANNVIVVAMAGEGTARDMARQISAKVPTT